MSFIGQSNPVLSSIKGREHHVSKLKSIGAASILATMTTTTAIHADTIVLREGGGDGAIDTNVDDTYVYSFNSNDNFGSLSTMQVRTNAPSTLSRVSLIAFADMFSHLPGGPITITSATLSLTSATTGSPSHQLSAYRMTTDWLPGAAGSNETNVTWNNSDVAGAVDWASGGFSLDDVTTDNAASFTASGWNSSVDVDVTAIIQDMVDSGENYGFALVVTDESLEGDAVSNYATSENNGGNPSGPNPTLSVTYVPEPASLAVLGIGAATVLLRRRRDGGVCTL